MKIAHVITRMVVGGAQENTLDSVRGLQRIPGVMVTLITGSQTGPEGDLLSLCPEPKVRVLFVPSLRRNVHLLSDIIAFVALWNIFRRERFDVVHTHSSKAGILGRLAAALAGTPRIVHTVHGFAIGNYQGYFLNRLYASLERWAARRTDVLICVARALASEAQRLGLRPKREIVFVPSGFDWELFEGAVARRADVRKELGVDEKDVLVVKVARFFPLKGHEELFECIGPLLQQTSTLKFLLVGDGILRTRFEDSVKARGWGGRVIFTGLVPPARVADLLGASDILVHTSRREGLARVIPQAFACRLPVVSYDADGARDLVLDGLTGLLVKAMGEHHTPPAVVDMAGALRYVIEDADLRRRMGQAGHDLAMRQYPLENMIAALRGIYGA